MSKTGSTNSRFTYKVVLFYYYRDGCTVKMRNGGIEMKEMNNYAYWKYSWAKWLVLIAGVLPLILILNCIKELNELHFLMTTEGYGQTISQDVFAESIISNKIRIVLYASQALLFVGIFWIGEFSKNRKISILLEVILISILFTIMLMCLIFWSNTVMAWLFAVLLAVIGGVGIYTVFHYFNLRKPDTED